MLGVFGDIIQRAYLSTNKLVSVDNGAFKLHYRFTFWLLLACTGIVCSRQYIGEHIRCIHDRGVESHVINTFCFFTSTYTVVQENGTQYAHHAHPGVAPHADRERIVRHAYYQWVPFVLFGQALLFYLPHLIWRTYESGTVRNMVEGLQRLYLRAPEDNDENVDVNKSNAHYKLYIFSAKTTSSVVHNVYKRFQTISRFRLYRMWAVMLVFCEFLNLANVMLQIRTMDWFLGGSFWSLGQRIMMGQDPFDEVFPKVTKCDFYKYGPSGTIQVHDAMCIMALNIVNEKIYALLWFWFAVLAFVSACALIWRFVQFFLYSRSEAFNRYILKETCGTKLNNADVRIITNQSCFADWLLLYYLGKNMDSYLFVELLHNLATDMDGSAPDFEDEKKPLKSA